MKTTINNAYKAAHCVSGTPLPFTIVTIATVTAVFKPENGEAREHVWGNTGIVKVKRTHEVMDPHFPCPQYASAIL